MGRLICGVSANLSDPPPVNPSTATERLLGIWNMAEKSASKTNAPAKNAQQEDLRKTPGSSADGLRQAMGTWANKL